MRILQVSNGFPPTAVAGVEQYTRSVSRALADRHEVYVLCSERAPNRAEYALIDEEADGLKIRRTVNNFRDVSTFEDLYINKRIERSFGEYVDQVHPDLVHFQHCYGLSATLPQVAARLGVPSVMTLHDYWTICPRVRLLTTDGALCPGPHQGADCGRCFGPAFDAWTRLHRVPYYDAVRDLLVPDWLQRRLLRWLGRLRPAARASAADLPVAPRFLQRMQAMQAMLNQVPRLLAPSRFVRELYVGYGVPAQRVSVVPLGLDTARWAVRPPRVKAPHIRFGYFGTLQSSKGVDVLICAFSALDDTSAELRVHGDGQPGDPFAGRVKRSSGPRVRFLGRYDNRRMPELLASVDVVVIPSVWHETFSIVAREALLGRVPVIATAMGALPEVVEDGINGLLVPPNDEEALRDAMACLTADPDLLARLRPAPPAVTDIHEHVVELERAYEQLLESEGRGDVSWGP